MQAANRGVASQVPVVPFLLKHVGEARGVVGEMIERHRAVLDEGNRLSRVLHRHHDVEAGSAQLCDRGLELGIEHIDHAAPIIAGVLPVEAEIAHQLMQPRQAAFILIPFGFREFHQQQRGGLAAHERLQRRAEHGDLAGERDHGQVDQFHRDRSELDDVLRRRHCFVEAAK